MLRADLDSIEAQLVSLVKSSPVYRFDPDLGGWIIANAADYCFETPTPEQLRLQLPLKAGFGRWLERFNLLFRVRSSEVANRIEAASEKLTNWIELGTNYDLTGNRDANARLAQESVETFRALLGLRTSVREIILIPDTNAITAATDPTAYRNIAGTDEFTFLLLPTVLSELDKLKITARDQAYRERVGKVIARVKGWRGQGSLTQGVVVDKTIRVRAIAEEPRFGSTLGWLDLTSGDDRIVASVLEVQASEPAASVTLVTGDINLQNKAEAARIPYAEPP
jgi:hypothetical protein